jgi:hypothetical protein
MKRNLPILVALLVLLAGGAVHGLWTDRWGKSPAVQVAARRLESLRIEVPGWKSEPESLEDGAQEGAGAEGAWGRTYTDPHTGEVLHVVLLCGPSGRMCVHRPEHCYQGAGYTMAADPAHWTVSPGSSPAEFWTTRFSRPQPGGPVQVRIFWSWFDGTAWQAPESPRWALASQPVLCKLYVVREMPPRPQPERVEDDPTVAFLEQFVPALSTALRP